MNITFHFDEISIYSMSSNKLSIALVSALLHARYGGPSEVLRLHAFGLSKSVNVKVYGLSDSIDAQSIRGQFSALSLFEPGFPSRWFYGKGLDRALMNESRNTDVLHAHMLWDYPVYASWKAAKAHRKPLIITPHGSLNNEWRYRGALKTAYRRLILDDLLEDASCVHVLNREEEIACRNYGMKCPIRIIPNGLPCATFDSPKDPSLAIENWPELSGKRVLLYLGRLWQGKGLDILPDAWAQVGQVAKKSNWLLVIAGPDYGDFRASLEKKVNDLDLGTTILLTGPVYGKIKESLMAASTLYVLPSHGEGFSMALLEAVAAKRPVLFTDKCNFTELANIGGGWEVADTTEALAESLRNLLEMDDQFFRNSGLAGWKYARERYSLESVSDQLIDMYKSAMR